MVKVEDSIGFDGETAVTFDPPLPLRRGRTWVSWEWSGFLKRRKYLGLERSRSGARGDVWVTIVEDYRKFSRKSG